MLITISIAFAAFVIGCVVGAVGLLIWMAGGEQDEHPTPRDYSKGRFRQ
jgi:hypothetical protein